ncbi:hypothetical protein BW900_31035, partial [Bacillus mycoides]
MDSSFVFFLLNMVFFQNTGGTPLKRFSPCFWDGGRLGVLGASPQELNVIEYRVNLLLRAIELAVR